MSAKRAPEKRDPFEKIVSIKCHAGDIALERTKHLVTLIKIEEISDGGTLSREDLGDIKSLLQTMVGVVEL